ncbi:MAG TPA: hypothetical protein PLN05_06895 [Pyrinomonadaceae bacterium]|nr:hypothetical protein [Chloracidobacterium sp.]HRJ89149.1 hypothetical protein [Pyrinomonadaceae bacterium]HRK50140.1 hypothetical protein [Pyrinomonadaceae bacterium]
MKSRKLTYFGLLTFLFIVALVPAVSAQDETMTNEEVISLSKAGLAPSVIIGKIRSSKSNFDLSTDSLIKLKQAGVSDDIVTAMLEAKSGKPTGGASAGASASAGDPNDPMSKHGYGIYLYEENGGQRKMTQLQPNVSAQNRTGGGFTAAVTPFGLGKVKTKANLPGRNANLQITSTSPVFYFYLDVASGGLNTSSGIPSSPNEFTLVRFNQRSDNREVTISKQNSWGGKGGLSDEYVVPLKAEDLGNGIFRVTPAVDLKKGEYGFYLLNSGNSNVNAGIGSKFFDFGVNMTP